MSCMSRRFVWAALTLGLLCMSAGAQIPKLRLLPLVTGLDQPVGVVSAPFDTDRIYIMQRVDSGGTFSRIWVYNLKTAQLGTFMTIDGVSIEGERGLLGMAFHPDYQNNGFFFVNYTRLDGTNVIARYHASSPEEADPASATVVLTIAQPLINHNAHWMAFSPRDGYVYIASGDGGGGNDPNNNAQDLTNNLLGKILRLDIDTDDFPNDPLRNYGIPPSNPFVGLEGDDEIWAYGLRNPWRNTFDARSGDLYIADVGQGVREEVNYEPAGYPGGRNYGWRCWEGSERSLVDPCDTPRGELPIYEYVHTFEPLRCAITGGPVYRGCAIPGLEGRYFYTDYCSGELWSFKYDGAAARDVYNHTPDLLEAGSPVLANAVSFGTDGYGEMYLCNLWDGIVYKVLPAEGFEDCNANTIADSCEIAFGEIDDFEGGAVGNVAAGQLTLARNCASCHRPTGTGAFGPNIRNKTRSQLQDKLTAPTTHPGGSFSSLGGTDFANLEAFLSDQGSRGRPDGVPDACQGTLADCDGNGVSDGKELALGTSQDLDFDGRPDSCGGVPSNVSAVAGIDGRTSAVMVDDRGEIRVLELDPATGGWTVRAYTQFVGDGTTPAPAEVTAFDDEDRGGSFFAAATSSELLLFDLQSATLSGRDLVGELPGSSAIVGRPITLTSVDGVVMIAGFNAAGELVMFWQTGQLNGDGTEIWGFTNIDQDHLAAQGLSRPAFVGELVSYVTPWNGLNIAGLDANGAVWAVWWSPGLSKWTVSNLSEITGAAPMAGNLTAYVTPWGGVNLAGLNASGEVVVTWWVPGAEWVDSNLSSEFNHPGLTAGELTSYVTPWGGLNLAGLDDAGELVIYWWAPGQSEWTVSPLSAFIPNSTLPMRSLRGLASPTGMLSLFGFTDTNDLVRCYWSPDGSWQAEDVTKLAEPK
jgi:glucose/arabinose dehydrogenase